MSSHGLTEVIGAIGIFILLTTVITVTIWQVSATRRAKLVLSHEADVQRRLAELENRVGSIEVILKDVE